MGRSLTYFGAELWGQDAVSKIWGNGKCLNKLAFNIPTAVILATYFLEHWSETEHCAGLPVIVGCVIARRDAPIPDPAVGWASPQHALQHRLIRDPDLAAFQRQNAAAGLE